MSKDYRVDADKVLKKLDLLLKDKLPNGAYVISKKNRITIIETELLIKNLIGIKNG